MSVSRMVSLEGDRARVLAFLRDGSGWVHLSELESLVGDGAASRVRELKKQGWQIRQEGPLRSRRYQLTGEPRGCARCGVLLGEPHSLYCPTGRGAQPVDSSECGALRW